MIDIIICCVVAYIWLAVAISILAGINAQGGIMRGIYRCVGCAACGKRALRISHTFHGFITYKCTNCHAKLIQ